VAFFLARKELDIVVFLWESECSTKLKHFKRTSAKLLFLFGENLFKTKYNYVKVIKDLKLNDYQSDFCEV
jgi:hypothetical protein